MHLWLQPLPPTVTASVTYGYSLCYLRLQAPCLVHLALKPCCLPGLAFAERGETFTLGGHAFAACEVCADLVKVRANPKLNPLTP